MTTDLTGYNSVAFEVATMPTLNGLGYIYTPVKPLEVWLQWMKSNNITVYRHNDIRQCCHWLHQGLHYCIYHRTKHNLMTPYIGIYYAMVTVICYP